MDLDHILARSAAGDAVKAGVRALADAPFGIARPAPWFETVRPAPAAKLLRLMMQLLHEEPALAVEHVRVDARSGCSDYAGTVTVHADGAVRQFRFVWDCQWRALQEGYEDCFGFPDQTRAAREFGWRCFAEWRPREGEALVA